MRATLAYTSARIVLLVVSAFLLYLAGARGLLLLALAFAVSGIVSFVLLSRQRDMMSGALLARLKNRRPRGPGFRARLEEGARAEDRDLRGVKVGYSRRTGGPNGPSRSVVPPPADARPAEAPLASVTSSAPASQPPVTRSFSTASTAS
jgi:hypothetical protein